MGVYLLRKKYMGYASNFMFPLIAKSYQKTKLRENQKTPS